MPNGRDRDRDRQRRPTGGQGGRGGGQGGQQQHRSQVSLAVNLLEEPRRDEVRIRTLLLNSQVEAVLQFSRDGSAIVDGLRTTVNRQVDFTVSVPPNTTSIKIKAEVVGMNVSKEIKVDIPPDAIPKKDDHKMIVTLGPRGTGRRIVTVEVRGATVPQTIVVSANEMFEAEILTPVNERLNGQFFQKQTSPNGQFVFAVELQVAPKAVFNITLPSTKETWQGLIVR